MSNFLKENWFKLAIVISIILVSGSFVYYFSYSAPKNRAIELELQKQLLLNQNQNTENSISTSTPTNSPANQSATSGKTNTKITVESKNTVTPTSQPSTQSSYILNIIAAYADRYDKRPSNVFNTTEILKSNVKTNVNTYKTIALRKVSITYNQNVNSNYVSIAGMRIEGKDYNVEIIGNHIIWEGYQEIKGDLDLGLTVIMNSNASCFQYQIDKDSLVVVERINLDPQNINSNLYEEKPVQITGTFPILSDNLCSNAGNY